jgi:cytochrome c biogenesis protein CcmG, thiol:disulfide interchange protein DsbE
MKSDVMSKKLLVYAVPMLIVGAVAWFALRPRGERPVEIGESVPDFTLPLASGSASGPGGFVRLADYRGRVLVLNFWATWCPPCVEETPSLEAFAEKAKSLGVVVLGASVDQDPAALAAFISKYHLTYPIARDPSRALATRYGTLQFPETYIIDRHGRLAEKIISNMDWTDPRMLSFVRELAQPPEQRASN